MVRFMVKPLDEMNKKYIKTIQILIKSSQKKFHPIKRGSGIHTQTEIKNQFL